MLPTTVGRVFANTSSQVNENIRADTEKRIAAYSLAGAAAIERRLRELDQEWDIERTLEANAATVSLAGLALGAAVDKRWFLLPTAVALFLLQHAVQGWCPPLEIFRRQGVRTASEIGYERYALKALRGDFSNLPRASESSLTAAQHALEVMR